MSRAERVAELIRQEVSDIMARKLNDPRIGFASVTGVDMGPDLLNANIYISILGNEEQKTSTMAGLSHAAKFIRRELGKRLELRDVPDIQFKRDDSIERGAKIFEIINKLHDNDQLQVKKVKKRRNNARSNKRNKKS